MATKRKTAAAAETPAAQTHGLDSLKANEGNPRKPWRDSKQKNSFQNSLKEFGDLSGIVFNRKSGQLVGGHKRLEEFRNDKGATKALDLSLKKSDASGTVAYGHVKLSSGVRFAYREVDWDNKREKAAMLAANRWSADWDLPVLNDILAELKDDDDLPFALDVTGFDDVCSLADIGQGGNEEEENTEGCDPTNIYSGKIDAPHYKITGACPSVPDLCNTEKADALTLEISKAKIPDEVKDFLTMAAGRHRKFDYENIAEYYAHAPKAVQRLMEKSALVIIDFDSAVANGFVMLSHRMKALYLEDKANEDA